MVLSDTEWDDSYDNGHEQNKIKVDDCITSTNTVEYDKPTTALYEQRDLAVKFSCLAKKKQIF